LAQHPQESDGDKLLVQGRCREEIDAFVALLDQAAGEAHEVQHVGDAASPFMVVARKSVLAQVVARLVMDIDYTEFVRTVHFDFGADPAFLLWVTPGGLQIGRVKPE
jgi:hypothetical protein